MNNFLKIGAIAAFLSVAFGAFGAHALKEILSPQMLEVFKTGVQYQFYHALALIILSFFIKLYPEQGLLKWSGIFFTLGIILFSGSLYTLTLSGIKLLGIITPFGGLSFLAGWGIFFFAGYKLK